MKKPILAKLLFLTILSSTFAQDINVPDPGFRSYLSIWYGVTFDADNDILDPGSAPSVRDVFITDEAGMRIRSTEGMAVFESMTSMIILLFENTDSLLIVDIPNSTDMLCFTSAEYIFVGENVARIEIDDHAVRKVVFESDYNMSEAFNSTPSEGPRGGVNLFCQELEELIFLDDDYDDFSSDLTRVGYGLHFFFCPALRRIEFQDDVSGLGVFGGEDEELGSLEELILPLEGPRLLNIYCSNTQIESLSVPGGSYLCSNESLYTGGVNNSENFVLQCRENYMLADLNLGEMLFADIDVSSCGLQFLEVPVQYLKNFNCENNELFNIQYSGEFSYGYEAVNWNLSGNHLTRLEAPRFYGLSSLDVSDNALFDIDVSLQSSSSPIPQIPSMRCDNNQLGSIIVRSDGAYVNVPSLSALYNPDLTCVFVGDNTAPEVAAYALPPAAAAVESQAECNALSAPASSVSRSAVTSSSFAIYPNPVINRLRVDVGSLEMTGIEVFDLHGRQIMASAAASTLDVSNLTVGTYLIRVLTTTDVHVQRFLKK